MEWSVVLFYEAFYTDGILEHQYEEEEAQTPAGRQRTER